MYMCLKSTAAADSSSGEGEGEGEGEGCRSGDPACAEDTNTAGGAEPMSRGGGYGYGCAYAPEAGSWSGSWRRL